MRLVAVVGGQADGAQGALVEHPAEERCCLVVEGRAGLHERQLELGMIGMTERQPAIPVAHGHIGGFREPELVDVEGLGGFLIGDPHGDE